MVKYKVIKFRRIEESTEKGDTVDHIYWIRDVETKKIMKVHSNLNYVVGVEFDLKLKIEDIK